MNLSVFWKTIAAPCQGLQNTTLQRHIGEMHHGCLGIYITETKPTLMTHTVLPKMRFLMTFIQINNTVYNFAKIK